MADARSTGFADRVLRVVARIPPGRLLTYGDVARLAGRPGAARAVGTIMSRAPRPGLPYHRVVAAAGQLGGYGGSEALKANLLRAEGITVHGRRIRRFGNHRWDVRVRQSAGR